MIRIPILTGLSLCLITGCSATRVEFYQECKVLLEKEREVSRNHSQYSYNSTPYQDCMKQHYHEDGY